METVELMAEQFETIETLLKYNLITLTFMLFVSLTILVLKR